VNAGVPLWQHQYGPAACLSGIPVTPAVVFRAFPSHGEITGISRVVLDIGGRNRALKGQPVSVKVEMGHGTGLKEPLTLADGASVEVKYDFSRSRRIQRCGIRSSAWRQEPFQEFDTPLKRPNHAVRVPGRELAFPPMNCSF